MKQNMLVQKLSAWFQVDVGYFLEGGTLLGSAYAVHSLSRFLLAVAFAYLASQEAYGQFQYVLSALAIIVWFSLPGMETAITQSVANGFDSSLRKGTLAKFRWSFIGSFILGGIAGFFALTQNQLWPAFLLCAILFPFYASFNTASSYFIGKEDFLRGSLSGAAMGATPSFSVIMALFFTQNIMLLIGVSLITTVIVCLLLYKWARYASRKNTRTDREDLGVVRFGKHLTWMTGINIVSQHIDKILLATLASFSDLAVYVIATALVWQLNHIGELFALLLLPKFSRPNPRHALLLQKRLALLLGGVVICSVAGMLIVPWLIPLFFSENYVSAVPYARVAFVILPFAIGSRIIFAYFQAKKKTKLLYTYNLGGGILGIVLIAALIPFLGIMGAVLARLARSVLGFIFLAGMLSLARAQSTKKK